MEIAVQSYICLCYDNCQDLNQVKFPLQSWLVSETKEKSNTQDGFRIPGVDSKGLAPHPRREKNHFSVLAAKNKKGGFPSIFEKCFTHISPLCTTPARILERLHGIQYVCVIHSFTKSNSITNIISPLSCGSFSHEEISQPQNTETLGRTTKTNGECHNLLYLSWGSQ